jgi:uncharacterized membrane protein
VNRARAFHALTAVVALVALVLQLVQVAKGSVVLVDAHPPGLVDRLLRYVAYFTIQSNVLVLVTTARLARDPLRDGRAWRVVRAAAISGITVTGLVHWFLLRRLLDLHGADYLADRMLHLVVPILAVLGWLVLGPRPRIDWGVCLRAAVWPLAWLVVILVQAAATGWYPYPFLNHEHHGWGYVLGVCVGILVLVTAAQLAQDPLRDGRAWRVVRTAAISGITVTGLVHWFLLRKLLDLHGADYLADRMLHLVVPILAVLGWLVFGPRSRIDWGVCLRAALWPLAWLVVILGQAAATGWYPYPFLDHDRHGWGYVLGVCVGILVLFFVVFAALREYDRRVRPDPARAGSTAVTGS